MSLFAEPVPCRRPPLTLEGRPSDFLGCDDLVDWQSPDIVALAATLRGSTALDSIGQAFHFVRDSIQHSWDIRSDVVSVSASDCLRKGTGICYAKSHLLTALLRALGVPSGFCYQRTILGARLPERVGVIHALNAVWLGEALGWLRIDARGNKPGVDARFEPPAEMLAFDIRLQGERDYLDLLPTPPAPIVETLRRHNSAREMYLYGLPSELPGGRFREELG
jgi:transglutaminase-like putative cysteine protease